MRVSLLVLLLTAGGIATAADDAALQAVETCRARLDPRTDLGVQKIRRRCPELFPTLDRAEWRDLLPQSLEREELSAESLRTLAELVREARAGSTTSAAPRADKLAPVLAALGTEGQQGVTRWERFKKWLKEKFEDRDDDRPGWMDDLSRQLQTSEGVARIVTYAGYLLVAALALYVVWAELRAAGLLGGSRAGAARRNAAAEWKRRLMLADVAAAPLTERPGLLLKLLGEALTRAHRLPAADGLTARALARRAQLETPAERDELERVAVVSDEVRYAAAKPGDAVIEDAVARGRALLTRFARLDAGKR